MSSAIGKLSGLMSKGYLYGKFWQEKLFKNNNFTMLQCFFRFAERQLTSTVISSDLIKGLPGIFLQAHTEFQKIYSIMHIIFKKIIMRPVIGKLFHHFILSDSANLRTIQCGNCTILQVTIPSINASWHLLSQALSAYYFSSSNIYECISQFYWSISETHSFCDRNVKCNCFELKKISLTSAKIACNLAEKLLHFLYIYMNM